MEIDYPAAPPASCTMIASGTGRLAAWASGTALEPTAAPETTFDLSRPLVVGRADSGRVPYLDPAYRSTTISPSGETILGGDAGRDKAVSRAHFLVKAVPGGIAFVNGVPAPGGGIRPPTNGTQLLVPERRQPEPGEELRIDFGSTAAIRLPNGMEVQLRAG